MNLGEREYVAGWCFDGWIDAQSLTQVLLDTVEYVDMTIFDAPVIREFPTSDGKGGEGTLAYTAINKPNVEVFVMLHESGIMGNSYKYVNYGKSEQRVRILLSSCKEFNAYEVGIFLKDRLDMPMVSRGQFIY